MQWLHWLSPSVFDFLVDVIVELLECQIVAHHHSVSLWAVQEGTPLAVPSSFGACLMGIGCSWFSITILIIVVTYNISKVKP